MSANTASHARPQESGRRPLCQVHGLNYHRTMYSMSPMSKASACHHRTAKARQLHQCAATMLRSLIGQPLSARPLSALVLLCSIQVCVQLQKAQTLPCQDYSFRQPHWRPPAPNRSNTTTASAHARLCTTLSHLIVCSSAISRPFFPLVHLTVFCAAAALLCAAVQYSSIATRLTWTNRGWSVAGLLLRRSHAPFSLPV